MKIQTEITGGAAHISLRGRRMVMGDADMVLRRALGELTSAGVRKILLDLSRVREIDGPCLQEILAWGRRLNGMGGELALVSPGLNDVKSLVTLLQDLRSFPGREEALTASPAASGRLRVLSRGPLQVLDRVLGGPTVLNITA